MYGPPVLYTPRSPAEPFPIVIVPELERFPSFVAANVPVPLPIAILAPRFTVPPSLNESIPPSPVKFTVRFPEVPRLAVAPVFTKTPIPVPFIFIVPALALSVVPAPLKYIPIAPFPTFVVAE